MTIISVAINFKDFFWWISDRIINFTLNYILFSKNNKMKKIVLLLAAGLAFVSANAQFARNNSIVTQTQPTIKESLKYAPSFSTELNFPKAAAKKTGPGGSRWYNYVDMLNTQSVAMGSDAEYFWHRDNSIWPYAGGTYDTMHIVSMGFILDPWVTGFNDPNAYPNNIVVTPTDATTLDSIDISGFYLHPNTSIVDTLVISYFYGNGSAASNVKISGYLYANITATANNYGLVAGDTMWMVYCGEDSLNEVASQQSGAPAVVVQKIPLSMNNYGDTDMNGVFHVMTAVPGGGMAVPAGNFIGCTYSFASGDASYTPYDTIIVAGTTTDVVKYNVFRPLCFFNGSSTALAFPPYHRYNIDANTGQFKWQPDTWLNYEAMWWWGAGSGAATLQYPYVSYHINCAACNLTTSVGIPTTIPTPNVVVSPNPASDVIAISFNTGMVANTVVTLTNSIGQVVATMDMGNVANGKANINVAKLANGTYFYTVNAGGSRATGHVVVAH